MSPSVLSFRDPAGRLISTQERILRIVEPAGVADLRALLESEAAARLIEEGSLVGTRVVPEEERAALLAEPGGGPEAALPPHVLLLEHERIPFPSYPAEWPPEMLHEAARLTLRLSEAFLPAGIGLKDATPYNVLFRGTAPVFVDVLSFERRDPGNRTWLPYAQFARTFLLPLLVSRYYGLSPRQLFTARRDGLEPEEVRRLVGRLRALRPPFLTLVTLPAWLGGRKRAEDERLYEPRLDPNPERARFVLEKLFASLRRNLRSVAPRGGERSAWSEYDACAHRSPDYVEPKRAFVEAALREHRPARVLDVGCNTGEFSLLAAGRGASVVAIDSDEAVVGELWRRAHAAGADVLPLVVDLARPTPAVGWRNQETASFLERARGRFDALLMLAVVHHLLVSERVPLAEILRLAAELTTGLAVIEFVEPGDPMFRRLTRGRDALFEGLGPGAFEEACTPWFEILRRERIGETGRWMYALRRRDGAAGA